MDVLLETSKCTLQEDLPKLTQPVSLPVAKRQLLRQNFTLFSQLVQCHLMGLNALFQCTNSHIYIYSYKVNKEVNKNT